MNLKLLFVTSLLYLSACAHPNRNPSQAENSSGCDLKAIPIEFVGFGVTSEPVHTVKFYELDKLIKSTSAYASIKKRKIENGSAKYFQVMAMASQQVQAAVERTCNGAPKGVVCLRADYLKKAEQECENRGVGFVPITNQVKENIKTSPSETK